MALTKTIDWARRWHWLWGVLPPWATVGIVSAVSMLFGAFQRLPAQLILMLVLASAAFAMIVVSMVGDAIERAMEPSRRKGRLVETLGNLRLNYIHLERRFTEQNGDERLWQRQTGLHNTARYVIEQELGVDYY